MAPIAIALLNMIPTSVYVTQVTGRRGTAALMWLR
jgi:hypothetical protein